MSRAHRLKRNAKHAPGSQTSTIYEIVAEFVDENVSGAIAIDKRPALKCALRALADDQADRLIVAKLDRLARNVRVALEIDEDYATRHGWGIVFGDMDIDTSTAVGKMQLSMFASVARFERDRISERTREALGVKRAQGVRLGRPSTMPLEIVVRIVAERSAGHRCEASRTTSPATAYRPLRVDRLGMPAPFLRCSPASRPMLPTSQTR
jgi:DNA invertase Pin-like site-specific DNA recombinase